MVMVSARPVDLLGRIQAQYRHDEQRERIKHFTFTFGYLIGCALVLLFCQCLTRVHNALSDPVYLNIDPLVTELDRFNGVQIDEHPPQIDWFSVDREYFQVEFGELGIELNEKYELKMFSSNLFSRRLLHIFSPVNEITISIVVHPDPLHIKLSSWYQHTQWPEKSMYATAVEQIYNRNATEFNMKVIKKCGIFVGYLYRPIGDKVHRSNSSRAFKFRKMDVVLDASAPHYPYKTFLLSGVSLSWLLFKALVYVRLCLFHLIVCLPLLIRPEVKYLLILNIDLHERQTSFLRQFHILELLTLISLSHIRSVSHTGFWIVNRFGERYEETMRLQYERNQRHLFARILEEKYQRLNHGNDFDRIWDQLTSASPHFIADFRLKTPLHVNGALLHERCSICLTKFERGEHYAQWPCEAQYVFHHACMLNVLRTQNTCPLCRHPVEAIQLPTFEALHRQFSSTISRVAI